MQILLKSANYKKDSKMKNFFKKIVPESLRM